MSRYRSVDPPSPNQHSTYRDAHDRDGQHSGRDASRHHDLKDGRAVFARGLDLPHTEARERVFLKDRDYDLDVSEVRSLATIGAFRVVDSRDVDATPGARQNEIERLRDLKLVEVVTPHVRDSERASLVTLTSEGRDLLECHRSDPDSPARQAYYAGLAKPRQALHDAQLYRAYRDAATALEGRGARIQRVVLDYELKREYQRFLQERNRGDRHSSGRPDRTPEEIAEWAVTHHLPVDDGHVQFPDVRIEYEHPDGRPDREDLELTTEHYSARQMAGKAASGFTVVRGSSSTRRGGVPFTPRAARVLR